jgi:hypothetical protein
MELCLYGPIMRHCRLTIGDGVDQVTETILFLVIWSALIN